MFSFTVETFVFLLLFQLFKFKYWFSFIWLTQIPEGVSLIRINAIIYHYHNFDAPMISRRTALSISSLLVRTVISSQDSCVISSTVRPFDVLSLMIGPNR